MRSAECTFLAWVLLSTCVAAQTTALVPEVRLEPHDGKTSFHIGEPIRLDLVIRNPTGTPMTVNTVDYGDNSDPVDISPKAGWIAWQGQSNHDYGSASPLGPEPVRIPVRVDQAAIFRSPGHYDVRVTEQRVEDTSDPSHPRWYPKIVSNIVGIDLEEMSEAREAEIVRGVQSDLLNATNDRAGAKLRSAAVTRLAALQGNIALDEKVKLLIAEQDEFRGVETEAWATTRDLPRQLELIQAAWRNPQIDPAYDMPRAMDETRRLMARRPLAGWQMTLMPTKPDATTQQLIDAHRQDMLDLLHSVPARTGDNRRDAAYYLVEFGGIPEADQAHAREYAIEEFPQMDSIAKHMLLETARPPFRDARLLPALKAMLQADPGDKDALVAMLDIAPNESKPFVVGAVCAPKGPPPIDAFAKISADRIPEVDACLGPLILPPVEPLGTASGRPRPGRDIFFWQQRVTLAARFGTPALLPAIEASGRSELAANPTNSETGGTLLAAEMRDDPGAALARLRKDSSSAISWYATDKVFESAHQQFPAAVREWLRTQVENGTDDQAREAAYQLSLGGAAMDRSVVENRLAKFRTAYRVSGAKSRIPYEGDLVSALLKDRAWKAMDRASITQDCVTESCREYAPR